MTQLAPELRDIANGSKNRLFPEDEAAHDWYRFVLHRLRFAALPDR